MMIMRAGIWLFMAKKLIPLGIVLIVAGITDLITDPKVVVMIFAYYTISIAVTSLKPEWDGWYNYFYRFSHGMVGVVQFFVDPKGMKRRATDEKPDGS